MNIADSREYKDLLETRQFLRNHRLRSVNEISTPAWRFLDHAEQHVDRQLSELTARAFYTPDEVTATILHRSATLDPVFAEEGGAQ